MKTLSIRQPWADLIIQGRKTLELRTWAVKYRGPLAIHASQTVEREACLVHGLDPDQVTTGAVIGIVDLVEIIELDEASYASRRAEHLTDDRWAGGRLYGWRLTNPCPLAVPLPMHGRMGLFESQVTDEPEAGSQLATRNSQLATRNPQPPTRNFELRILPIVASTFNEPTYRLVLHQRLVESPPDQKSLYESEPPVLRKVAELSGSTLRAVADHVMEALRANGYKPTELGANRREPFPLAEETGVRLGLLFLAVRPITKMERIEVIAQGIRAMTSEEAYYWYAKCTGGPAAERAQRALRMLLANE